MFYKITNRSNLGDYKEIDVDSIQAISYSPDMTTAIVKLSTAPPDNTDILESSEKEYRKMQKEYEEYISSKETVSPSLSETEKLKAELKTTQLALLEIMLKGDLNE